MTTTNTTENTIVATVEEGKVKPIVIMLDAPVHTKANGYQCGRRDCPCYADANERRNTARLHSSNGFSLLR